MTKRLPDQQASGELHMCRLKQNYWLAALAAVAITGCITEITMSLTLQGDIRRYVIGGLVVWVGFIAVCALRWVHWIELESAARSKRLAST